MNINIKLTLTLFLICLSHAFTNAQEFQEKHLYGIWNVYYQSDTGLINSNLEFEILEGGMMIEVTLGNKSSEDQVQDATYEYNHGVIQLGPNPNNTYTCKKTDPDRIEFVPLQPVDEMGIKTVTYVLIRIQEDKEE